MKKKKVMIIANNSEGLYRFRKELILKLIDQGYELIVLTPFDNKVKELKEMNMQLIDTPISRRGMNPGTDGKLIIRYASLIRKINPDVVLTYTIKPNLYGGVICHILGIPYIINVTGLGTALSRKGCLSSALKKLYQYVIRHSKHTFFQNKQNEYVLLNRKIRCSHSLLPGSGVNLEENCYEEYPEYDDSIRFMFVGRIMKDKGIEEYLSCAETIKKKYKNVTFDIIGEYDDHRYESRIKELCDHEIVNYLGQRNDVHDLMRNHHAIIHPSYHEGLSNVLLEAASCGRPVIASNISGCRETFDEGVSGIGFEAANTKALIDAVEKFINISYDEKKQMGIKGRKKISREFDRTIVIESYLKIISNIIKEKKK